MRPIPAPRLGDAHGLLRAIGERGRVRLDEFVTEFPAADLFPPGLENALGRTRQFVAFARAAGLLTEDRGTVELTEIGKRYVRAGDPAEPFEVSEGQAGWLLRQLRERHMTDSIYHGLAIGLSLLSSVAPGTPISKLDFGRALGYLGRAGWDNDNTLEIQGERYLVLLADLGLIDETRGVTRAGSEVKSELTLPVHMSLLDIAGQQNPGGPEAVRAQGEAEWAVAAVPEPVEEDEWQDVGPTPPADVWETVEPDDHAAVRPQDAPTVISPPPPDEPVPPPPVEPAPPPPPVEPAPPPVEPPRAASEFLPAHAIRRAAEAQGLRLPAAVYANVAAALAAGKHVLLTGAPGAGKTTLALAIAQAAAAAGRSSGAVLVTASERWSAGDTVGRRPRQEGDPPRPGHVVDAAGRNKWLVIDELDRARLDKALGALSSFLAGLPVTLPGGGELEPPDTWRIVATAAGPPAAGSAALIRRFARIELRPPTEEDLEALIRDAAGGDETAAGAARRLLTLRELRPLGAGVFADAARHAAGRNAIEPADEHTLAREAYGAYVEPLMADLDDSGRVRLKELLGS